MCIQQNELYWAYFNFINKNAFQLDAYCPLQWPSLGGVGGVCLAVGCLPVGVCVSAAGGLPVGVRVSAAGGGCLPDPPWTE